MKMSYRLLWLLLSMAGSPVMGEPTSDKSAAVRGGNKYPETKLGDWIVTCTDAGSRRLCQAVQGIVQNEARAEITRLSFLYDVQAKRYAVQAKVPLGSRIDVGTAIRLNESNESMVDGIRFNRCAPEGCYAEKVLSHAEIERIKTASDVTLVVISVPSKPYLVKHSVNGLATALQWISHT